MKIVLMSIGTRGDMEPFLAIGEILKEKGHQVICAFPEQFRGLAEDSHLGFASLGEKFINLLDSDLGKAAMGGGGSGLKKILANVKLASHQTEANKELVFKQREIIENEGPDRVVYNGKATYPIVWGLDHRGKNILVCPLPYMHYVRNHAHVAFNGNYGPFLNKLTYGLADFGLIMTIQISARWLKTTRRITRKQIKNALSSNKAIYTVSPTLFSRPDYWGENLKVLGFQERDRAISWRPDNDLRDFLEKHHHERVLLVTFGSMSNPEPAEKTSIITGILERNKIPAIINTAAGGLVKAGDFDPELIHFVPQVPYDWVFPRMYGVIHHGGSGTTHLALKYGCASMIIPHIIDQFVWNKVVHEMGAGPEGVKIDKITAENLEPKILALVNNPSFKREAERVASQMEKEDFRGEIYRSIVEV
jgi:sterol 3beta-glucosyltransferase